MRGTDLVRPAGDKLLEFYSLGEKIGVGAYSKVYSATSITDGTKVALKMLRRRTAENEDHLLNEVEVIKLQCVILSAN
jgi:RIO-like serine/threonine protein kinase